MSIKGKCLCGAVGYEISREKAEAGACHCGMCRAFSGGVYIAIQARAVEVTLSGREALSVHRSSAWAERAFCSKCGSAMFYRLTAGPSAGEFHLAAGALESWKGVDFIGEIFVDRKPGAYAFAGEHPRMTEAEFLASIGMTGAAS